MVSLAIIIVHVFMGYCTCSANLLTNKYHFIFYFCTLLIMEDYEKLKAKVADNEVYITEILEEKTQVEDKKQIITG